MRRKLLLSIIILSGIVGLTIFQAGILKVSAQVAPVLGVAPGNLAFGIVFPGEKLYESFTLTMIEANADSVDYVIKHVPKPRDPIDAEYCRLNNPLNPGNPSDPYYVKCYPNICEQISEMPDGSPNNDVGVSSPHDSSAIAYGHLDKSDGDTQDDWTIDLITPCFEGMCAQGYNPATEGQALPAGLEGQDFGCDLIVEVSGTTFPLKQVILENKDGNWNVIQDGRYGELTYNESGPTFNYTFNGYGLNANTSYSLIYYADGWPGNNPGAFLGKGTTDGSGNVSFSNNINLNMNLPSLPDANYANGAKIWLVPSIGYTESTKSIIGWNAAQYLFETSRLHYQDTDLVVNKTVNLANLGATPQYGYNYDYSAANVSFNYNTPATGKLIGTITATGLKPYFTYQVKFDGKPTCIYGGGGDDATNEKIGYLGRWWNNTTPGNVSDAYYEANSTYKGGTQCITGYLAWDYITADGSGNVTKTIETDNSYHVLWCSGGTCGLANNTLLAAGIDPAHPALNLCSAANVNGQIERFSCEGMTLSAGVYNIKMTLTEESFHQGPWTGVMNGDINFEIK